MNYRTLIDLCIILLFTTLFFGNLIFVNYISHWDFSTIPFSTSFEPSSLIFGYSRNIGTPFSTILQPGINVIDYILYFLVKDYSVNLGIFIYLLIYEVGLYYLVRSLYDSKYSIFSLPIGVLNPAIFNLLADTPIALYLAFFPLFLALYIKARMSKTKPSLYYLLLFLPLGVTSVYGPVVVSIMFTIVLVEIYALTKKNFNLKRTISLITMVIAAFTLIHLNVLLNYQEVLQSTFYNGIVPSNGVIQFNALQIFTFNSTLKYEQIFYELLPGRFSSVYQIFLLSIFVLGTFFSILRKNSLILIMEILIVAILSYAYDPLIYNLFTFIFPVLNHVDPFEYTPLISVLFTLLFYETCSYKFPGTLKYVSNKVNWKRLKSATKYIQKGSLSVFVILIVISVSVFFPYFSASWSGQVGSQNIQHVYKLASNDSGVTLFVPSSYAVLFNYSIKSYDILGVKYSTAHDTQSPFYVYPKEWIAPSITSYEPEYSNLYAALYSGNKTEFQNLTQLLQISNIVYFNNNSYVGSFNSPYIKTISDLLNITGFTIDYNLSGKVYILSNPNLSLSYNIQVSNYSLIIHLFNDTNIVNTNIPYSSGYTSNYGKILDNNGLISIYSNNVLPRQLVITSKVGSYNAISFYSSSILIFLPIFVLIIYQVKKNSRSK